MSKADQLAQKYSREELWEKFDTLPDSVKTVILAPKTLDTLDAIADNNNLSPEAASKLWRYVELIMAGIVPITLLRETIEEELRLDEDHARKIAVEVRDKIFIQVQDELRKIHGLE